MMWTIIHYPHSRVVFCAMSQCAWWPKAMEETGEGGEVERCNTVKGRGGEGGSMT